ncbi:MAG: hypothetical protein WDW38_002185 [Sanguina aurantia]
MLQLSVSQDMFDQICRTHVFAPPSQGLQVEHLTPTAHGLPTAAATSRHNRCPPPDLQAQLSVLRSRIQQERQECHSLSTAIAQIDSDLRIHGSSIAAVDAIVSAACTDKDNVALQLSAVVEAAQRLQPLLEKAAQLKGSREAAGGGGRGQRGTPSGGGRGQRGQWGQRPLTPLATLPHQAVGEAVYHRHSPDVRPGLWHAQPRSAGVREHQARKATDWTGTMEDVSALHALLVPS